MAITKQQIQSYRDNGYLVVENVLDAATIGRIRQVIAGLVAKAAGVAAHNDIYDLEPTHTPENPRVRRIKTPHKVDPLFWDVVRYPNMLGVVKALLGPNVRLHGSKLNIKAPKYGSPVEWHQDWAFYPHTNDDILAIGVMLDDVELENGPLLVTPGTHKGPVWNHHGDDGRFCGLIDPAEIQTEIASAVPLTGRAGSMSFHHVRSLHGSALNTSDRNRNLLLYGIAAADAWPLLGVGDFDEFNRALLCGAPTLEPRMTSLPVRLPLPPAAHEGSIYENQTGAS